jgi:beta-lactamase regulating signal transducer with metallopeptidase domain/ketosteroid isomerase-like protein
MICSSLENWSAAQNKFGGKIMTPLTEIFNSLSRIFCHHAYWMLIQTGVLVTILWLLDTVLRKRVKASIRYCIWLLVLVKLVLPVDLSLPSGIGYWLHFESPQSPSVTETVTSKLQETTTAEPVHTVTSNIKNTSSSNITAADIQPVAYKQDKASNEFFAKEWIFVLWLTGVVILTGVFIRRIVTVRRIVARSKPITEGAADFKSVLQGNNRISVRLSEEIPSPAVCGLIRPVILIPSALIEKLDKKQLEAVLLHELSHIQRGDLWLNTIQSLLQIFYFYNPFVRLGNHFIRKTREQANDERVLIQMNGRRDCYSETLIEVAAAVIGRPVLAVRLIGVAEPKSNLYERIKLMMQKPIPKTVKLGWTGGLAVLLLGCILLPMSAGKSAPGTTTLVTDNENQNIQNELEKMDAELIQSFNEGNVNRMVSMFTEDGICLPNQLEPAIGRQGLTQYYIKTFREHGGLQILDVQHDNREFWAAGDTVFGLDEYRVTLKTPSIRQVLTDYKKSLFIAKQQPDGSFKMVAVADSLDPVPFDPLKYQADKNNKEPHIVFHTVETENISTEQMAKNIETVKALDIEFHKCFVRHDADAALDYYADDATLLPLGKKMVRGREALSTYIKEGMKEAELVNNNQRIIDVGGTDKMIYIINEFTWQFKTPGNPQQINSMPGKGIHVWQKQPDGQWKLLLDIYNISVPQKI